MDLLSFSSRIWLHFANKKLVRTVQRMGIKNWDLKASGQLESTLLLAYAQNSQRMQFVSTEEWSAGVYKADGRYLSVFMAKLAFNSPHLYFDYMSNNSVFRRDLPRGINGAQLIRYEGYMEHRCNFFAPAGYRLDALVIGAPDLLEAIDSNHHDADIEMLGTQLYFVYPNRIMLADKLEELVEASRRISEAANDNLSRYVDKHPASTKGLLSPAGRRIIRK